MHVALNYQALQRLCNRLLKSNRYDQQVEIDVESRQDLLWWIYCFPLHNSKSLTSSGCGNHIRYIDWAGEQLVRTNMQATLGTKKSSHQFHWAQGSILSDEVLVTSRPQTFPSLVTAISFINHKGGTHSNILSDLALQIWTCCIKRNITICAEHIPEIDTCRCRPRIQEATRTCRVEAKQLFVKINVKWGPLDVDLIAVRHNYQLQRYFSCSPDLEVEAIDALAQNWKNLKPHVFPPFSRCLKKIRQESLGSRYRISSKSRRTSKSCCPQNVAACFCELIPINAALEILPHGKGSPATVRMSTCTLCAYKLAYYWSHACMCVSIFVDTALEM